MEHIQLPELIIPFPSAENAITQSLERHATDWVLHFHLIQSERTLRKFQLGKFWLLVSYCFPHGLPQALQTVVEWDCWAFMLDDQSDVGHLRDQPEALKRLLSDLLAVLDGALLQNGPLFTSLQDVWEHMQRWASPAWRARFRHSVAETFAALVWEAENRAQGIIPDPASYIAKRNASSGFATHMDLADFTDKIHLPTQVRKHPIVQQLTEMANHVISWTNDLYSLEKEMRQGDNHNLVLIEQEAQQISLQAAADLVGEMINQEVRHFSELKQTIPHFSQEIDEMVQRYIGVLQSWMRGNLDWSQTTGRYDSAILRQDATAHTYLEPLVETPLVDLENTSSTQRHDMSKNIQSDTVRRSFYGRWEFPFLVGGLALAIFWLLRHRRPR